MSTDDFGTTLATREFLWEDADGDEHGGYVDISTPTEHPADGDRAEVWTCQVRLRDLGSPGVRTVYGADGVQAVYLALVAAGAMVGATALGEHLDWAEAPNFGFPPPPEVPAGDGGGCCGGPVADPR